MSGSQIRNSCTLIQKPCRIASNDSRAWKPLKNSSWTRRPAGRGHDADHEQPEDDHRHDRSAISAAAGAQPTPYRAALELVGARGPAPRPARAHCSTGTSTTLGEPLLLELGQGAVGRERGERLVDAGDQRVALLEQHPELLLLPGLGLELADDRALRDLHGGDVERGRQVGEDRVDLAVEQRLLGGVGVLEDRRLVRRLDHVADRGQRRGAGLGAEVVVGELGERRDLRGRRALERDHGLRRLVVAVGEVDDLGARRRDRDLVDVEVEVLRAGLVGVLNGTTTHCDLASRAARRRRTPPRTRSPGRWSGRCRRTRARTPGSRWRS